MNVTPNVTPNLSLMRAQRGMSLIEVMVAIGLFGVLMTIGLPSLSTYMQNSQVRTASEMVQNGIQIARGEALKRNARVELIFTSSDPTSANVGASSSTTGKNWIVRIFQTGGTYTAADFIQGGGTYNAPNAVVTSDTASIVFDGLGRTNLAGVNLIQITNPTAGACFAASGPVRCLNVQLQTGGQHRMCDPAVTTAGDTRACS